MKYNFDEIICRENTQSVKWDNRNNVFGRCDVIPLWVADMDFKTADFIIEDMRKRLEHEIMAYVIRPCSFFEAAQGWLKRRNGWQTEIKDMIFTPGVVPALEYGVESLTNVGDKVLIQSPVYTPFFNAVKNHGRVLIENGLIEKNNYYTIDFEDLEKKLADNVKLFIFCSPHNPVGRVWTREELERVGNLCVKYNVTIISDEIHSDLVFKPYKHIHLASISNEIAQCTITCLTPSKSFNIAGLSTAMAHSVNPEILTPLKECIDRYHVQMGNIFGNVAFESAYSKGDEWLEQLLDYLQGNINWATEFIKTNIPQIKVTKTEGTYLLWLDFRAFNICQDTLNQFMIGEARLGLNCGAMFGEQGKGFMRLNTACPRQTLMTAMEQLKAAVECHNFKHA